MAWMGTHGVRNHEGIWKLSRFYSIGFGRLICKKHCSRARVHSCLDLPGFQLCKHIRVPGGNGFLINNLMCPRRVHTTNVKNLVVDVFNAPLYNPYCFQEEDRRRRRRSLL